MKLLSLLARKPYLTSAFLAFWLYACAPTIPNTPTPSPIPPPTVTPFVIPTSTDTFYNAPAAYSRELGTRTQTIRLGVSSDFGVRPILPFFGLSLADSKYQDRLFEALTYNHFFRWQEADWKDRSLVKYDDFKKRLAAGEDLAYPVMDTRTGGANAHLEQVNPAADMDILLIAHHDGFVTFPGSATDPGLSVKNTVNPDGSLVVRVPLVYAQLITFHKGDPQIQDLALTATLLALMQLGIPPDAITNNDRKAIRTWWETIPEENLHSFQYEYLKKLLTDETLDMPILRVWDERPGTP